MSSPVVTVPPGMRLKQVADLLVTHGISAVLERRIKSIPIVEGRQVVGIVARRDLLAVLARSDEEIAAALERLLAEELGPPSPYRVTVRDETVQLTGPPDPSSRRLAELLARGAPGVVDVRPAEE